MKLMQTIVAPALLCITLLAQEAPTTSPGTVGGQTRAAKVRSPEVLADGRATFRLLAPKATEVLVQGNWEGGRGLAMTRDDSGLWSVTTKAALQPEVWAYTLFGGWSQDSGSGQLQRRARRCRVHEHAAGAERSVGGVPAAASAAWNRLGDVVAVDGHEDAAPYVRLHPARVRRELH